MIFLNNVYITNEKAPFSSIEYNRGLLPKQDKLDIYKYSLASMATAYPWSKVIIYYQLSDEYQAREGELLEFIDEIFPNVQTIVRSKRNEYIKDWVDTYELLDDDLIWFYCNHDHIFIESTEYLEKYVNIFREKYSNKKASIYFSHWPEMLCRPTSIEKNGGLTYAKWQTTDLVDSIQIITKQLYEEWWVRESWKEFNGENPYEVFFPRSDFNRALHQFKDVDAWEVFIPLKELCRHFDGYGHTLPIVTNSDCPSLAIPEGFFEKDIKIFLGKNKKPNYINFNPLSEHYSTDDINGADYKWTTEDIPRFWKDRISIIEKDDGLSDGNNFEGRKKALLELVFSHSKHFEHKKNFIYRNLMDEIMNLYGYKKV